MLAPFFLGLTVGIVLLLIKFIQELVHLSIHVITATETDIIIGILTLVDMSLVGSLLLMIIFSGYEIFVSKIDVAQHTDRPDWMPFAGRKASGLGVGGIVPTMLEMTEEKMIVIRSKVL